MENAIARKKTPEEDELDKKLVELTALEAKLAQGELDLATLQGELQAFEREYFRVVGVRYTEIDRIEAQIAEYMASLETLGDFEPSHDLKQLYREVAKRIHPDLATDEEERSRRQRLMAEANQAYEDGDEERLRAILRGWGTSSKSTKGQGVVTELVGTIRKISQSQKRLKTIQEEVKALEQTDLYQLKTKVITAQKTGQDLLVEMASQLDEQINAAKERLEELKAKLGLRT